MLALDEGRCKMLFACSRLQTTKNARGYGTFLSHALLLSLFSINAILEAVQYGPLECWRKDLV